LRRAGWAEQQAQQEAARSAKNEVTTHGEGPPRKIDRIACQAGGFNPYKRSKARPSAAFAYWTRNQGWGPRAAGCSAENRFWAIRMEAGGT
jgi:hypothetical protein